MTTNLPAEAAEIQTADLPSKGFKVYELEGAVPAAPVQGRRDFYKIVLVTGDLTVHSGYSDEQAFDVRGPSLFLANPHVPHSVTDRSAGEKRFVCLFTEAFLTGRERTELLRHSPLTRVDVAPVVPLTSEQAAFMTGLFQNMLVVYRGEYGRKSELLHTSLKLLLHEAARLQPAPGRLKQKNAAARITDLFLELLERQFPIESTVKPLQARTAQDFAGSLAVHVNYLNRAVKEMTGKPTSAHIAERIAAEAKALLQHTNWRVADIAYSLGFEYPAYFNNFFKRVTGRIPKTYRAAQV